MGRRSNERPVTARGDRSSIPEFMDYQETDYATGLGAVALGTHHATAIEGALYVTPHRDGEYVNPNAVYVGVLAQAPISPIGSGVHMQTAGEVQTWAAGAARGFYTYITEPLDASQPPIVYAPEFDPTNARYQ